MTKQRKQNVAFCLHSVTPNVIITLIVQTKINKYEREKKYETD